MPVHRGESPAGVAQGHRPGGDGHVRGHPPLDDASRELGARLDGHGSGRCAAEEARGRGDRRGGACGPHGDKGPAGDAKPRGGGRDAATEGASHTDHSRDALVRRADGPVSPGCGGHRRGRGADPGSRPPHQRLVRGRERRGVPRHARPDGKRSRAPRDEADHRPLAPHGISLRVVPRGAGLRAVGRGRGSRPSASPTSTSSLDTSETRRHRSSRTSSTS